MADPANAPGETESLRLFESYLFDMCKEALSRLEAAEKRIADLEALNAGFCRSIEVSAGLTAGYQQKQEREFRDINKLAGEKIRSLESEIYSLNCRVEELKREARQPRWIPCSERLPEMKAWVLVYVPRWSGVSLAEYSYSRNGKDHFGVIQAIGSIDDVSYDVRVTHWMPLPAPPEES